MACSGCTNGCNTCSCSDDYRVTTGAIGPTGATGPQGPAGPAGNVTFLYSTASTTGVATLGTGAYEPLGTTTLTAGEMSTNYDKIIITAKFLIADNTRNKYMRITFGTASTTAHLENTNTNTSIYPFPTCELVYEIVRVSATTQVMTQKYFRGDIPTSGRQLTFSGAETLANALTINVQALTQAAGVGVDDVKLMEFNVIKIDA